jgi:hypothetical protein
MPAIEIGCCGSYCGTCRGFAENRCHGCKLGYGTGERDLSKARCSMKRCCLARLGAAHTCADCPEYPSCRTLRSFYSKNGYKYKKYQEAAEFIRRHGYEAFLRIAEKWSGPYGKLPPPGGEG